jgi:hypothetical protein
VSTNELLYWMVGMLFGSATVVVVGRDFVSEHGRKLIPWLVVLGLAFGVLMGWALNAWINYIHFTAGAGGRM